MMQLSIADYRVRFQVVKQLKYKASSLQNACCEICFRNASFELAQCYKVGFGVTRDENETLAHLEKSGRSLEELDSQINRLKGLDLVFQNDRFEQLWGGQVGNIDFAN